MYAYMQITAAHMGFTFLHTLPFEAQILLQMYIAIRLKKNVKNEINYTILYFYVQINPITYITPN